jgi:hypothetical protein
LTVWPTLSPAHHAAAAVYDRSRIVEVEGKVTDITWRNPHVRFVIQTDDDRELWEIESNSVSILSRMDITPEVVRAGDTVRVADWPARQNDHGLVVMNMLLADGREVLLAPGIEPRWSRDTLGTSAAWLGDGAANAQAGQLGIFRVWSDDYSNPRLFDDVATAEHKWPLTAQAAPRRAAWDPVADSPYLGCTTMGMPRIMGQPYPMEFVDAGDTIALRIELYDAVRTIHMAAAADAARMSATALGFSVGHWEGPTLVVETSRVDWPYFDQTGVPQSEGVEIVERFTPSEDGSRLDYVFTVTDPATFTEPVTLGKFWIWRPGEQVQPFDCEAND